VRSLLLFFFLADAYICIFISRAGKDGEERVQLEILLKEVKVCQLRRR
jgi:hypothetical protein